MIKPLHSFTFTAFLIIFFLNSTFYINYSVAQCPSPDFIASDTVICDSMCVVFTDLSAPPAAFWYWQFSGGTPSVSNQQNPTVCYNTPGFYDVMLITDSFSCPDTALKTGYIAVLSGNCIPVVEFDCTVDSFAADTNGGILCKVSFNDLTANSPASWYWDFGDGAQSALQNPSHTYTNFIPTSFDISLMAENSFGKDTLLKPSYVTINNNGCYCGTDSLVITSNISTLLSADNLLLFPNPVEDEFTLEFFSPTTEKAIIELYDIVGLKVSELYCGEIKKGEIFKQNFGTGEMNNGIYLIKTECRSFSVMKRLAVVK